MRGGSRKRIEVGQEIVKWLDAQWVGVSDACAERVAALSLELTGHNEVENKRLSNRKPWSSNSQTE